LAAGNGRIEVIVTVWFELIVGFNPSRWSISDPAESIVRVSRGADRPSVRLLLLIPGLSAESVRIPLATGRVAFVVRHPRSPAGSGLRLLDLIRATTPATPPLALELWSVFVVGPPPDRVPGRSLLARFPSSPVWIA
jgi:hypothetical protein